MTTQAAAQAKKHRGRRLLTALPVLIGLLVLAGCGSSSSSSSSASTPETTAASTPAETTSTPAETSSSSASAAPESSSGGSSKLSLSANKEGQLSYNTKTLSAKAGAVSIAFENASPVGHNVTIESSSGETVGATPTFQGGSKTVNLKLKPGTYKFFCSVPGHRQAGMEGTITVK
ncbi:MAG TPA: plastocyanin/azurin family copper-binding protein [Solirubrobacteraceae bacterium]|nr:plastocyanin/azurin family copper-binding protein [Solirubrobacteraceae bacterium]